MLWSVFLTTPLMVGFQIVSARIGVVTGHGIARNIRDHYSRSVLWFIVSLAVGTIVSAFLVVSAKQFIKGKNAPTDAELDP